MLKILPRLLQRLLSQLHASSCGLVLRNNEVHIKKWLFYHNTFEIKKLSWRKMQCCCSTAIYVNFPHHLEVALSVLRGARSFFHWKLHPSSQAWPLLSTSNCGETAIAKCGNWTPRNKLQWNFNRNPCIFIPQKWFEIVIWKMAAILSQPQCVNGM